VIDPHDPQLQRRNLLFGLALAGVFLLLFAGTFLVALIYLAVD
jgi:predicted tellurium resistance membrane protein TerC